MKTSALHVFSADVETSFEEDTQIAGPFGSALTGPVVEDLFAELCRLANSDFSAKALDLYWSEEYEELVRLKTDKSSYTDAYTFAKDYAVECFFKKYSAFVIPGVDVRKAAHEKWVLAEESCSLINEKFRKRWNGDSNVLSSFQVEEVLHLTRINIASILRTFDVSEFEAGCRFGPGSDTSTKNGNTSAYNKYATNGRVTAACAEFLLELFVPSSEDRGPDIRSQLVEHSELCISNSLLYVPKNALTERVISKEPRWNIFAQLGIGEMMSFRLRSRAGIDIRDQQRNQVLAQKAFTLGLCTIDLSSASDSLAANAVIDLFDYVEDPLWIDSILKTRSPYVRLPDGKMHRLEKISSMGNGYTFPLETLVFYAVTKAVYQFLEIPFTKEGFQGRTFSVYGDDIVCDRAAASLLIEALSYLGFAVNTDKTFLEGPFYESCGCDYFVGQNVRPPFVKKDVCSVQAAYTLANQFASFAIRLSGDPRFAYGEVWNLRKYPIRRIPSELRFTGPAILGDSVIHSTLDVYNPRRPKGKPWTILWEVTGFICEPKGLKGNSYRGHLLSKLHGGTQNGSLFYKRKTVTSRVASLTFDKVSDVVLF